MRPVLIALPLTLMVVSLKPCVGAGTEVAMRITTADFPAGGAIPRKFTADGADSSPALVFEGAPAGTQAFALIVDDPDAPVGLWVHWVLYDLPAGAGGLAQNQPRCATLASGARQGKNSWSRLGWNGPSPPPGRPHHYFFKLYALGSPLGLPPGATAQAVEAAMKGKVLAQAELVGSYGR
ncbi:MAG: YbhB/YbcL family Raf kinase inhibitor-like protein [Holophaga sp.]|nr:YbhB/YbcL family Raf kinase inhibitor-like protein [Holophaga sp.]